MYQEDEVQLVGKKAEELQTVADMKDMKTLFTDLRKTALTKRIDLAKGSGR